MMSWLRYFDYVNLNCGMGTTSTLLASYNDIKFIQDDYL